MMSKKNTFTDFVAVAEALVADKYTSKERLVVEPARPANCSSAP